MTELLSPSEAGRILGVSRQTIYNRLKDGYFPNAFQSGLNHAARWKIPLSDVKAYDRARREKPRKRK